MSLVISQSALRLVESFFDQATVAQAVQYVAEGRVHLVKSPPWPVVAQVRGSAGYVVTVHFTKASQYLRGECSCETAVDCKHVAATALAAFASEAPQISQTVQTAQQAVVGQWLMELGRAEVPGALAEKPAKATKTVAYLLKARDEDVSLVALQCAILASGELSPGRALGQVGAETTRETTSWMDSNDERRIAMLRAVSRTPSGATGMRLDRIHGDLLRDLAHSGRLFWNDVRSTPLSYGPSRSEKITWTASANDPEMFQLTLKSNVIVLAARECHYVDTASNTLGPLDLGMSVELSRRLLTGPMVPAAMRDTVARSLAPLFGLEEIAHEDLTKNVLRPRMTAGLNDTDRKARHVVQIVGEAVYGDDKFLLGSWDADRPKARDLLAEGTYRDRLTELLQELPHGAAASSSMQLLADARFIAQTVVPTLRSEGWQCILAENFPHDVPLEATEWIEKINPSEQKQDWFSLELGVSVAGRTISLLPVLLQAIKDGQLSSALDGTTNHTGSGFNLRLPEGELIYVPADRMRRWLAPLVELFLNGLDANQKLLLPTPIAADFVENAPYTVAGAGLATEQLKQLLNPEPITEDADFIGELRDYQRVGVGWIAAIHRNGQGGLLADEMGLGKTVQVLAFLEHLRSRGELPANQPALVIAPRSVLGNWQDEAKRFAPKLSVAIHVGADRDKSADALGDTQVLITSYQTLLRDLTSFRQIRWTTVFCDEAQTLKNPTTTLRKGVAALRAKSKFCISGTPTENHLTELWSQFDLVMPGWLGVRPSFEAAFRRPIEKYGKLENLELLRKRIRPFLLRRTKESVELQLPGKTQVVERIELDVAQRDLYESLRLKLNSQVHKALAQKGIHGASMRILDALLKLRQCCCDPRLIKLPEAANVNSSAKLERLLAMLQELHDSGRTTLVFSQFTSMLALIETACKELQIPTAKLTGETRNREAAIARFRSGQAKVFLISLKAGGVGLNLTEADTVIHYDPWWNPAAEMQATDRAHRIGQDKPVMVYKLVAKGTLEERIYELQTKKQSLSAALLRDNPEGVDSPEELHALYQQVI